MYYRGAQAAIVVYDITNAGENNTLTLEQYLPPNDFEFRLLTSNLPSDTFERAKTWVKELQRQVKSYKLQE